VENVRKFLSVIARVIAAIFATLFVITAVIGILLTTLNGQIFNANLYKNALVEQNIYSRLPEIVGAAITRSVLNDPCAQNPLACSIDSASPELQACLTTALGTEAYQAIGSGSRSPTTAELQLAQPCLNRYASGLPAKQQMGMSSGGMSSVLQNITAADWQAMLTIVLPTDEIKAMTESTLDQTFAYLNGEGISVYVPLESLKQSLLGPNGAALFLQVLMSQQPCNEQDLFQLISGMSNGGMVLCSPPKDFLPLVSVLLPELLKTFVPLIPDKAYIIQPPAPGRSIPGSGPFGADPVATLRIIRLVMRLSLLVPLVFLLLVTLLAVRSIKSWMRWWGIPFFASGIISLGLGISIVPALNAAWTWFVAPRVPVFIPAVITGTGFELLRSILHNLAIWIIIPGIILSVLGLGAWIGSNHIKGKFKPEQPSAMPAPMP
jgi:hypothetical protein